MAEPMWQSIGKAFDLVSQGSVEKVEGRSVGHEWSVTRDGAVTNVKIRKTQANG